MSLGVTLISKEGIVLASDSRATIGDPRGLTVSNDTVQKIFQINRNVGLIMAGEGAIGATLVDALNQEIKAQQSQNGRELFIEETVQICFKLANHLFSVWFGAPQMTPQGLARPWAFLTLSLTGFNSENKPETYILISANGFAPGKDTMGFTAIGVVPLAIYLFNRLYERSLSMEACMKLAAYAILETATQDGKVGGPLQMAVIKEDEGFQRISEEKIRELVQEAKGYRLHLKKLFMEELKEE